MNTIDEFYDRFSKLDKINLYKPSLEKIVVSPKNNVITNTRSEVGRRNSDIAKTYANYFYIYDQRELDITYETIQDALSEYVYKNPNHTEDGDEDKTTHKISPNTIKTNYKKMKELIEKRSFENFFHTSFSTFDQVIVDDE